MQFFLGTHKIRWLWDARFRRVPLFVSTRQLLATKTLKPAVTEYAIDSAGFTALFQDGFWSMGPAEYVELLRQWVRVLGVPVFIAPQDWMCEEIVCASVALHERLIAFDQTKYEAFRAKIAPAKRSPSALRLCRVKACLPLEPKFWEKRIRVHQSRTVANYLELHSLAPELPFIPVLQGYSKADYLRHLADYRAANVHGEQLPRIGVGSVCRRQKTEEAADIIRAVAAAGVRPHGFGFKTQGLELCGADMVSADSMSWSYAARFEPPLPGCRHGKSGKGKCNNCPAFALAYYRGIVNIESDWLSF